MHDVAVGDDIVFAFQPELAGVARAGFAAESDVVGVGDSFGADEALLEVGMDHAGGRRRLGAAMDGPGPRLLGPNREIGDEVEQLVAGADQPVEAGFLQAQRFQEFGALLARQGRDLGFDLGGNRYRNRAFRFFVLEYLLGIIVVLYLLTFLAISVLLLGIRCSLY